MMVLGVCAGAMWWRTRVRAKAKRLLAVLGDDRVTWCCFRYCYLNLEKARAC
jgi:hypothetical protein